MAGTAVGLVLTSTAAYAQQADNGNQLEQVVVTATRQSETVNRVPLSITAQTQRNLDQQGIRTITDLQSTVPALQVTQQLGTGVGNFSLRGIVQSAAGAATTGFYLDDTPLQKRNNPAGVATANGTPVPPLFDLERVEVLRGPQGTLYGGSSQGGTIRYIQPAPSLTKFSEYVKLQGSVPKSGSDSYEIGAAVGGPIIQDKLGFRVSADHRDQGGFIDMVDPISRQVWANNTGRNKVNLFRGALTWAPTDRSRVTFSYLSSRDETDNVQTTSSIAPNTAFSVPTTCFNTALYSAAAPSPGNVPPAVARGDAACNAAKAANPAVFILPGATYGPYNLKRYQSLLQDVAPTKTNLQIANLTLDYEFEHMTFKSISSYIDDQTKATAGEPSQISRYPGNQLATPFTTVVDPVTGQTRVVQAGLNFNAAFGSIPVRNQIGHFVSDNRRYGFTQEFRFASAGDARPFSWVAGVYYSNIRNPFKYDNYYQLSQAGQVLYGYAPGQAGVQQRYGVGALETAPGLFNNFDARRQNLKDVEIAAFAEGNYWITEKLRATVGLRVSRVTFDFNNLFIGPVTGVGADASNPARQVPNAQNGGANSGSVSQSPVTPKFGLQYQITENDLVYVSAAKGFRPGGINPPPSQGICGNALNQYGLTPTDVPLTYNADTVWSYEAGAKLRMLENRVQLNGSVYRIDWKNPQVTISPGFQCGLVATYNADAARSQGFELEAQARVFRGLTMNAAFGYTDAKYTSTSIGIVGRPTAGNGFVQNNLVITQQGQRLPVPKYSISVGGRYDVEINSMARAYLRADWRYAAAYDQFAFGIGAFNPDVNTVPAIQNTNVRVGVEYRDFDINLFVNNLFDRKDGPMTGGRSGCALAPAGGTAACNTYTVYTPIYQINQGYPREIGVQLVYRH